MNACADITNKVEDSNCLHCTLKTKIIGSFIGLIAGFVMVVIIETVFITRPPIIIGHEQVVAFMQAGKLRAETYLDLKNPFPLEKIEEAYAYTRARKGLKALVKIAG